MRRQRLLAFVSAILVTIAFMPNSMFVEGFSQALAKNGNGDGKGGNGKGGGAGNGNGGNGNSGNGNSGGSGKGNSGGNSGQSRASGGNGKGVATSKGATASPTSRGSSKSAASAGATSRRGATSERARTSISRAASLIDRNGTSLKSRDRILVKGLDGPALRRLSSRGFVVERRASARTGVVELHLPKGRSLTDAAAAVFELRPGATVATNDFYYPAGHDAQNEAGKLEELIAWPASDPSCHTQPTIGMIDTAVDLSSPPLLGRDVELLRTAAAPSDAGHGTAVASILVGNAPAVEGLLPAAKLIAIDAFSQDPNGDRADAMSLIQAIDMLVERNVDVINLSLAGPPNQLLKEAIDRAIGRGIPVVAAVGNDGPGAPPKYPAGYPAVVAVTATDQNLSVYRSANRGDYIDFSAPTISAAGAAFHGTSFAAPVVSAALAVIKRGQPTLMPAEAEALLERNAIDLGVPGRDAVYGWGFLQAEGICGLSPEHSPVPVTVSR
ncbi:S8 family serine peptidase [Flaviflagellibacter deserti]|uniref:S8 family serine peptidase n=1 Tax=Flaviflagellibacter deserti TaxID=2267266 RepID=A0ABV9YXC9_9HYPH